MPPPARRTRLLRSLGCLGLAVVVLLGLAVGGFALLRSRGLADPSPFEPRCVAVANDLAVTITPDQAHYTAIITGVSVERGLSPRAASIAMATVYQETGIRNLDGGDRDSVGLFQQRPSQGWGTVEEIMDPYYSTGRFYDALVEVDGWETGDINDVAQEVQRSGYPEAYRDHEADARVLASVFTGHSPAALRCSHGELGRADVDGLTESLTDTLGDLETTEAPAGEDGTPASLSVRAPRETLAWTVAAHAVANAGRHGVQSVEVAGTTWTHDPDGLGEWLPSAATDPDAVRITFTAG
ncbi:hypothetical protein GC722_09235 [Auraticoccus sp. F435]|uniref:Heavy metal transporter n=1 Tax=Auraticoccus cholistanensis TaxID=2656650 RepID=A0A6A9UX28_9ACTN|nr:hypothetical protein [Auraticoccus cholistanensis]MVA76205.1 hypothetical protein [Auraticoccus cholistanensis]